MDPEPVPRRRSIASTLLLLIAVLLIGMGGMAWLVHRYDVVANVVHPLSPVSAPVPFRPAVVPVVMPVAPGAIATDPAVSRRIDDLEGRIDTLDTRINAVTDQAARADGLLVAFAARRALDRGIALGYLESVLRDRFGGVEPQAVATVISASRQPVTIEQLRDQLSALSPKLSSASADEGWWEGFKRELGGLIVVRKASTPSTMPIDRLARAMDDLSTGHVDSALAEVARLPAQQAAQGWIASARRYVQARVALDQIETAALLRPQANAVAAAE
jgi:hypothetical protein